MVRKGAVFISLLFMTFLSYSQKKREYKKKSNSKNYFASIEKKQQEITSIFHKNNIGKIVFSKTRVTKLNPNANLTSTFSVNDNIYGRVFTEKSPSNTKIYYQKNNKETRCTVCTIKYNIYVNNILQKTPLENIALLNSEENSWTTRQVWINPKLEEEATDIAWINAVNKLPAGKHKIRIEFIITGGTNVSAKKPSAVGEFTLIKKKGDKIKIGKNWNSLPRGMNNIYLEKILVKKANANYKLTNKGSKYIKAKIFGREWTIVRNKLTGVPAYRWIEVYFLEKEKNGACYVQTFPVIQQYNGKNYGNTKISLGTIFPLKATYNDYIDCND